MSARLPRITPTAPSGFFTVKDICTMRNIDEDRVREWIRSGQLPATVESGKTPSPRYLVAKEEYRRFLGQR